MSFCHVVFMKCHQCTQWVSMSARPQSHFVQSRDKEHTPCIMPLQVYIQTIGACLVQAGAAKEGPTVDLLHRLTFESTQLLGCIMLLNHNVHKAMLQGQMDSKLAKTHSIDKFYKTYVVGMTSNQHCAWSCYTLLLACIVLVRHKLYKVQGLM